MINKEKAEKTQFDQKLLHDAMQSLAYWLGCEYKRYRFHELREIAIVNELVHLMEASLKQASLYIDCEVSYADFSKQKNNRKKVDLAICLRIQTEKKDKKKEKTYQAIIEVKRLKAREKKIEQDICRIAEAMTNAANPELSGWVIACSPGQLPSNWLNKNNEGTRRRLNIDKKNIQYRIRRIVHAYPSLKTIKTGFHVALLEVLKNKKIVEM